MVNPLMECVRRVMRGPALSRRCAGPARWRECRCALAVAPTRTVPPGSSESVGQARPGQARAHQHADGGAQRGGAVGRHAAQDFARVGLAAGGGDPALPRPPAVKLKLNLLLKQRRNQRGGRRVGRQRENERRRRRRRASGSAQALRRFKQTLRPRFQPACPTQRHAWTTAAAQVGRPPPPLPPATAPW